MSKEASKRCGYSSCEHYNKHNKESGCKVFSDRGECQLSMNRRKKSAKNSKKNQGTRWW